MQVIRLVSLVLAALAKQSCIMSAHPSFCAILPSSSIVLAAVVAAVSVHSCMQQAALVLLAYLYLLRPVAAQQSICTDGRYLAGT